MFTARISLITVHPSGSSGAGSLYVDAETSGGIALALSTILVAVGSDLSIF
jgi:hypothetical protein